MTIQPMKRSQVAPLSVTISQIDSRTETIGSTGMNGVRNGRGRSGSASRRSSTPIDTRMNANSVPMLTRSASVSIEVSPARIATSTVMMIVSRYGVPKRGCVLATAGGEEKRPPPGRGGGRNGRGRGGPPGGGVGGPNAGDDARDQEVQDGAHRQ